LIKNQGVCLLKRHLTGGKQHISLEYISRSNAPWFGGNVRRGAAEAERKGRAIGFNTVFLRLARGRGCA
jgi:hypothetical protein